MVPIIRIGVNASEANVAHRVGSNVYAYRLLMELEKISRDIPQDQLQIEWTIYLPKSQQDDFPERRPGWKYKIIGPSFFWTQWRLPLELFLHTNGMHVFLSLGHYAPRFCPVPSSICILDLAFLKFPQFFRPKDLMQLRAWTDYSAKKAELIFTISKSSKADIESTYKKNSEDIPIIYPGVDSEKYIKREYLHALDTLEPNVFTKFLLKEKAYIVAIGTIQPRKNMVRLLKAFEQLIAKNPSQDTKLVFVGKPGWMTKEFDDAVAASPIRERVVVTGFVDDAMKYVILRGSLASVLIGYYEGFGIPAVESMLYGITPVVANTASLPEVVGEFGVLVDPFSVDSITRGIEQVIFNQPDPMRRMQMREWATKFSWVTSSRQMLDALVKKFGPETV
ncbi:MAG TPA: glycosyltransferase family 1 protein [Patescibacteria group bacterium]|nr:glycosyltransferase family 1 protein [Patescibacteria group bacterium]